MTLQWLYEYAEENGIEIYTEMKLHNKKAFAIEEVSGERAVVLDRSKIETRCEEKAILSEELGHLHCDALCYVRDYSNPLRAQNIRRAEYKALSWAYLTLLPYRELKAVVVKEKDLYRVAEHFDVPFSFLQNAILFYQKKGRSFL